MNHYKESLSALHLPDEFVWPAYDGRSIANVPATVAALLDVPFTGLPPLPDELWRPLSNGVKRVVVLILDALGWNLWQSVQTELDEMHQMPTIAGHLTSVFPSTTVAALSSLWTGAAPSQHGLLGLRMFFPEYAVAGQMLKFTPVFRVYPEALTEAGLEPESFLQSPGFAEQLTASGVPTYVFKHYTLSHSTLSRMHSRGVTGEHGIVSLADMLVQIQTLLDDKVGERLYICGYWHTIDTLSHNYNWRGTAVTAELRAIFHQLKTELFQRIRANARQDTAFFIVADHGQIETPSSQHIFLSQHPDLQKMLLMRPVGEPRVSYLYARQNRQADIISYINEKLGHAFTAVPAEAALKAGLFGPEPHVPEALERIGDVVVIARQGYVLLAEQEQDRADRMQGRHGGMTAAEMEVPWLGFRLDA